jgi:hypothetical protein
LVDTNRSVPMVTSAYRQSQSRPSATFVCSTSCAGGVRSSSAASSGNRWRNSAASSVSGWSGWSSRRKKSTTWSSAAIAASSGSRKSADRANLSAAASLGS